MNRASLKVVKPSPSSALEELVGDYLAHRRAQGKSVHTIALNTDVLKRRFLPWCAEQHVGAYLRP